MTLSRRWVRGAVWVVMLMVGSFVARAQEVSGSISGTILDATGAAVSGAKVTVTNTDRAYVERTTVTDKAGFFTATSLPLGNYSVAIAMKGFKTATVTGLVLHASDALKVDQRLVVGAPTENLTIVANQAAINLENGMSEGLVTGTQIRELVLNNRNYEQLLLLQPGVSYGNATSDQLYLGVSNPSGASNQVQFSIGGSRPTANNWTIDGADNVDRGANLTLLAYPSVDAISEIQTLRGAYEAEYGRSASGQINVVTRSGTNDFHGGAYEFFRNDIFNANNFFSKLTTPFTPVPRLRYNDFGGTIGGPVIIPHFYNGKDKTFFFFSEEIRRVVNYSSQQAFVPTSDERNGIFTNSYLTGTAGGSNYTGAQGPVAVCSTFSNGLCTGYSTSTVNPSATALAYVKDIYQNVPLPPSLSDIAAGLDPHQVTNNIHNISNDEQEMARVDHALNTKVNVFYRYLHDSLPTVEGGGLFSGTAIPGVSTSSTHSPGTQHLGHMTIAARPTFLIDMGYAYSSGAVISTPIGLIASANSPDVKPIVPFPNTLGVVPTLTFAGSGPTIGEGGLYNDHNVNHNGFGNFTKIKGQHTLKFGISYNHYQKLENSLSTNQGNFSFTNPTAPSSSTLASLGTGVSAPSQFDAEFANFLIGNANGGFTQSSLSNVANVNESLVELYGQDDWRATRRLTINLGVRYSFFGQPYDKNNELSNFDPSTFQKVNQETISSHGDLCTITGQSTFQTTFSSTGVTTTYTLNSCPNVNGLNAYQPNTAADPLNGIILASPDFISQENKLGSTAFPFVEPPGAPAITLHGSPFGLNVGHAEKHDWAPRVGFAWDVYGDGKTALRGGYGIAYDDSAVSMYEQAIFLNPPFVMSNTYGTSLLDNPAGGTTATGLSTNNSGVAPPALRASPLIYQTPYVQQFSLDVQQAVTPTMTLDVGYFGDHGTHLQGVVDINEVTPGAFVNTSIGFQQNGCSSFISQSCEAPLNQIRPYPGYTAINAVRTAFNSNYNSLQVKFTKRFSGKSMIDANYTFSRGLTNAQNDYATAPQNTYNLAAEYGPSVYNRNDVLAIDGVWELPWYREQHGIVGHVVGGWEFSGLFALNSGLPLTPTMTSGTTVNYGGLTSIYNGQANGGIANDSAGLGILGPSAASLRPNQVLNPNDGYGQVQLHKRLHWFNQTAFVAPSPASFQVGNEKRGVVDGPGFNRFDVGIFRSFRVYHNATFTLRGEGYNVLNHTNWGSVGTSTGSTSFGTITATRDPRILQVAGKINF